MKKQQSRPLIESLINTAAIALSAFGVQQILVGNMSGYLALLTGLAIEYFKYWGRNKNLW